MWENKLGTSGFIKSVRAACSFSYLTLYKTPIVSLVTSHTGTIVLTALTPPPRLATQPFSPRNPKAGSLRRAGGRNHGTGDVLLRPRSYLPRCGKDDARLLVCRNLRCQHRDLLRERTDHRRQDIFRRTHRGELLIVGRTREAGGTGEGVGSDCTGLFAAAAAAAVCVCRCYTKQ